MVNVKSEKIRTSGRRESKIPRSMGTTAKSFLIAMIFLLVNVTGVLAYRMWSFLMNLEEMTQEAQRIVVGVCLERKEGKKVLGPKTPPVQFRE